MNNSLTLDESFDVEQMVVAFDIENFLEILEISSLSTILDSERIGNPSIEQNDQIDDPPAANAENIVVENPNVTEEHTVASSSNSNKKTAITDIIEKEILVNDESNCVRREETLQFLRYFYLHSVENSADEIDHQNNELIANRISIDIDETTEENMYDDGHMMEETELVGISNPESSQNSLNSDQNNMGVFNVGESQVRNAIASDSNSFQTESNTSAIVNELAVDAETNVVGNSNDTEHEQAAVSDFAIIQTTETREFYRILYKILLKTHLVSMRNLFEHLINLTEDTRNGQEIMGNNEVNCVRWAKTSDFIGSLNSNSAENSADEFNHRITESTDDHVNTELDKRNDDISDDTQMSEGPELIEILNSESAGSSLNNDQHNMIGSNIGESEVQNAIDRDSNSMQSMNASVLYATPRMEPMLQQLDENIIDLVASESEEENFNDGNPSTSEKVGENTRNARRTCKTPFSKEIQRSGVIVGKASRGNAFVERKKIEKKSYVCYICKKAIRQFSNLKKHMRVHTGERPFKCLHCQKRFSQKWDLKIHIRAVHDGEKPFQCRVCEKRFTVNRSLKMHIRAVHDGEKPFQCQICEKKFARKGDLKKHTRTIHNRGKKTK